MTSGEAQVRAVVAQQAADWFIANQDPALGHADRAAFFAWLKASPVHVEEYLGVALVARDLPAATDDPQVPLEPLLELARADADSNVLSIDTAIPRREPPVERVRVPHRWSLAGVAAAAAVVLLAGSVFLWTRVGELGGPPQTYQTAHGEQRVVRIADGSVLHLNTDSAATVRFSWRERVVVLDRGQALFEVAHESGRRFRVIAGKADVIAVGTQFDVYRHLETTVITVADGRVAVLAGERSGTAGIVGAVAQPVDAGYQLQVDDGVIRTQPARVELQRTLAWLQHKIAFERRPLGEVADEFNRYGQIPFEIEDARLRALPVSGIFNASDTDSFADFLARLDGVRVDRSPTRIRVFRTDTERKEPLTTSR
jgi:transmembrane sensor